MGNAVLHFEFPVEDAERAREFYEKLFGWQFEKMEGFDYWMIKTNEGQGIDGGMMKREMPQQTHVNYVNVESVDEHSSKAEELGAQVVVPKQEIPGIGIFAIIMDQDGNPIGLWQDIKAE